jgi:transposase InsO family protein
MSKKSIKEYFKTIYGRYHKASKAIKNLILNELCANTGYNRKYAIRKLNNLPPAKSSGPYRRRRRYVYSSQVLSILTVVWEAAGYPCSVRLKALLQPWMPWIRKKFRISPAVEKQLLSISARQMDRRLKDKKVHIRKRIYGRTRPGTLLKHRIPIRTDNWDVKEPGWTEVDTVSHSGNSADGLFAYTVNQTDILTTWVESRAVLGKGEEAVVNALDEMAHALPFALKGLDSDNGSEFINWHLLRYCENKKIQPFRGRPYKKDDNAHIEQKNWTHVRKLMGWDRYDTQQAVDAMNDLHRNELRLFMNLFLPSMKLLKKQRVGSKRKRVYDKPKTPFQRVWDSKCGDPVKIAKLKELRDSLNPFDLAHTIESKLESIYSLANRRQSPKAVTVSNTNTEQKKQRPLTKVEKETFKALSQIFPGLMIYANDSKQEKKT